MKRKKPEGKVTTSSQDPKQESVVSETVNFSIEGNAKTPNPQLCNPPFVGVTSFLDDTQVKWVSPDSLKPCQTHQSIYGEEVIDLFLFESIKKSGVLTPLIIDKNNIIISGIARWKVSKVLNLVRVPVVYSSEAASNENLVSCNISRHKSYSILFKEYEVLKKAFNISQGARTDLRNGNNKMKASELPSLLGVSRATISRLCNINQLAQNFYKDDQEQIAKVWEEVDHPRKGIISVTNKLNKLISKKRNSSGEPMNLWGNGYTIYNSTSSQMTEVKDGSIQLVITSPPYYGGIRDYDIELDQLGHEKTPEEFAVNLANHFDDTKRVLKPSGSLVVNIADTIDPQTKQQSLAPYYFVTEMAKRNWHISGVYIWLKSRFRPTLPGKRGIAVFEYIYHFSKSPNYDYHKTWVSSVSDPIYNPVIFGKAENSSRVIKDVFDLRDDSNDGVINWACANESLLRRVCDKEGIEMSHSATFPIMIPSLFINLLSIPGDTVLDPFSGTATTGAACKVLGRNYIGYELNKEYIDISRVRLKLTDEKLGQEVAA